MSLRPTFMGFETMRKSISAAQKALDITGNNIANVSTVGYSRQRLDLVSINTPGGGLRYQTSVSLSGQGVTSPGVTQIRDSFLDKRYREINADSAMSGTTSGVLTDIENVLDVIDTDGFNVAYQSFKDSLSKFATDSPNRVELANITLQTAQQVIQTIRGYDTKLNQIQAQTKFEMQTGVNRASEIIKQIANLNTQIVNSYVGSGDILLEGNTYNANTTYGPNELKDQRNTLLDELSNYGNIKVTNNSNGSINVDFADVQVVKEGRYSSIQLNEHSTGTLSLSVKDDVGRIKDISANESNQRNLLSSGSLRGYLNMYNGAGVYKNDVSIRQDGMKKAANDVNQLLEDIANINKSTTMSLTEKNGKLFDYTQKLQSYGDFVVAPDVVNGTASISMQVNGEPTLIVASDGTTTGQKLSTAVSDANNKINYILLDSAGNKQNVEFTQGTLRDSADQAAESTFTSDSGIVYYRKVIDALANTFARSFNEASSDKNFTLPGSTTGEYFQRNMFATTDGGDQITAGNIKISDEWSKDPSMITKNVAWVDENDHSLGIKSVTEDKYELWSGNIGKLLAVTTKEHDFTIDGGNINKDNKVIDQTCSFDNYVAFWSNKLGQSLEYQNSVYKAADTMATNISTSRDAVMGVSMDEEGANMMNFQKWYNASARMMTTLDEALDTIINGMGRVGR